jgi:Ankyrin repeats (3 copies)
LDFNRIVEQMGNAISSTASSMPYPVRPFDPGSKRSCFTKGIIPTISTADKVKGTTLHQLILLQDWQRVLIRAKLYPSELQQYCNFSIGSNASVRVLPLHLVCALDPPVAVVDLLVDLYADACATPIEPVALWNSPTIATTTTKISNCKLNGKSSKNETHRFFMGSDVNKNFLTTGSSSQRRWRFQNKRISLSHRFSAWRQNRRADFPVDVTYDESLCFLSKAGATSEMIEEMGSLRMLNGNNVKRVKVYDTSLIDHEESMPSDDSSLSLSSQQSFDSIESSYQQGSKVILQISTNGGLHPLPIDSSGTEYSSGSSSKSSSELFRVHWDFGPLYEQVTKFGMLLPIHIACLFSAKSEVVQTLVSAFLPGCLSSVAGMIPIHLVAAGWCFPTLLPPPILQLPIPLVGDYQPSKKPRQQLELLHILKSAMPDTLKIKSGNHGMTAIEYVSECMEESQYKKSCQAYLTLERQEQPLLLSNNENMFDDYSCSTAESYIFNRSDTSSICRPEYIRADKTDLNEPVCLAVNISDLMIKRDWSGTIDAMKADHFLASQWIYGLDQVTFSKSQAPMVWKRLPIHLACAYCAPESLIALLIECYPESLGLMDPHDGSLPLHIACQHSNPAIIPSVKLLLEASPEAAACANSQGQLPLHVALISLAPLDVIDLLLKMEPKSLNTPDYYGMTAQDYADQMTDTPKAVMNLLTEAKSQSEEVESV